MSNDLFEANTVRDVDLLERMIRNNKQIQPAMNRRELGILGYRNIGMGIYKRIRQGVSELVITGQALQVLSRAAAEAKAGIREIIDGYVKEGFAQSS